MTGHAIEQTVIDILSRHQASRIAVFGSRARDDAREDSDLDLLVSFATAKSLFKLVAIERELSETLGLKVDLLTEAALSPHLRERIRSQLRVIYQ